MIFSVFVALTSEMEMRSSEHYCIKECELNIYTQLLIKLI